MTIIMIILLLSICASCTTKRIIEYSYVHDTISVMHTDTVREKRYVDRQDSASHKEVKIIRDSVINNFFRTVVINQVGDTVKDIQENNTWHRTSEQDSILQLQLISILDSMHVLESRSDSLQEIATSLEQKQIDQENKKTRILNMLRVLSLIFLIIIGTFVVSIYKSRKEGISKR